MDTQNHYQSTEMDPIFTEAGGSQPATLQLEELEKVFEMFHLQNSGQPYNGRLLPKKPHGHSFKDCQI
jgi:hypothetical protein